MVYNQCQEVNLECSKNCYFEPTFHIRESDICFRMSGPIYGSGEDRRQRGDTHLALLGVKIAGNGTSGGLRKMNGTCCGSNGFFLHHRDLIPGMMIKESYPGIFLHKMKERNYLSGKRRERWKRLEK